MKRCTKCEQMKPLEQFCKWRRGKDGYSTWCKACKAQRERERRAADPEHFRAKDRERYLNGRHGAAYARKWRKDNPERNRERARAHYWANREDKIAYMREQKFTRWGRDEDTVAYIKQLAKDPCSYCGEFRETHIDHVEPRAHGGEDHWSNLTLSCRSCNARKADRPMLLFLAFRNGCFEYRQDVAA